MDDLIRRQWLMECVNEGWIKFDTENDKNRYIHLVRDIAPSAQPEPTKRGKWVRHYIRPNVFKDLCWHCSECGYQETYSYADRYYKFCPRCGAYMGGE